MMNRIFISSMVTLFAISACGDDDVDDQMMGCPPPNDPFEMSSCLLNLPDQLRQDHGADITYKVDLYLSGTEYYYAFLPSTLSKPIEVYDACCNNICRIGFPPGEPCDWRDTADDLGKIWEE